MEKPAGLHCEAPNCYQPATSIYGPDCEMETGKLRYLCRFHTAQIKDWIAKHPNEPTNCPTHGNIGKVKHHVVLKAI